LDAINLLKGLHILGQPTSQESDIKQNAPAIAPDIDVRPPLEEKPKEK
jgi:hypothetical protein